VDEGLPFIVTALGPDFHPQSPFFRQRVALPVRQVNSIMTSYACGSPTRLKGRIGTMSIDKSLRRKNMLARSRNVLTRGERIKVLQDEERWPEGRSPFGLPKVRVLKIAKKPKKVKEEVAEGEAPAEGAEAGAEEK
jgi:small basic protein (TIGR04137 family)